jgi:hypothetical protein
MTSDGDSPQVAQARKLHAAAEQALSAGLAEAAYGSASSALELLAGVPGQAGGRDDSQMHVLLGQHLFRQGDAGQAARELLIAVRARLQPFEARAAASVPQDVPPAPAARCPQCAAELEPEARFCGSCGRQVDGAPPVAHDTPGERLKARISRRHAIGAGVGAASIAVAGGAAYLMSRGERVDKPARSTTVGTGETITYSRDAALLVVPSVGGPSVGGATLLDSSTLEVTRRLATPAGQSRGQSSCAALSADGALAAAGTGTDERGRSHLMIWRVADGSVVRVIDAHAERVANLAFTPTAALLVSVAGGGEDAAKVWRLSDGAMLHSFSAKNAFRAQSMSLSPDGATVAVRGADGSEIRRLSDGARVRALPVDFAILRYSLDGSVIAAAGLQELSLFGASDGELLRELSIRANPQSLAVSSDATLAALGYHDGWIDLVRLSDGRRIRSIKSGRDGSFVNDLDFRPDNVVLAAAVWPDGGRSGAQLWTLE